MRIYSNRFFVTAVILCCKDAFRVLPEKTKNDTGEGKVAVVPLKLWPCNRHRFSSHDQDFICGSTMVRFAMLG